MNPADQEEAFMRHVMESQRSLYSFIMKQIFDLSATDDVLQDANLVFWKKRKEFSKADDYRALCYRVARNQVLAWRKSQQREHLCFDDALLEMLAVDADLADKGYDDRRLALGSCLGKLGEGDRRLIDQCYGEELSGAEMAESTGRTADSIYHSLHRIRQSLLKCIQRTLAEEDHP